jgi:acetoin utilization deacetylase AcuC-like enzyme
MFREHPHILVGSPSRRRAPPGPSFYTSSCSKVSRVNLLFGAQNGSGSPRRSAAGSLLTDTLEIPVYVFSPDYHANFGAHVFPVEKYRLIQEELAASGERPDRFHEPAPASRSELELVHTPAYLDDLEACRLSERTRWSELPLTPEIVRLFVRSAGGTILASRLALREGWAMHLCGGFHHAFADRAEGFCYVNDLAVAVRVLQHEGAIGRAAILDCDLHQGNGTARIFQGDDTVFTFSIHQHDLYPVKEKSDLDIHLPDRTGDDVYLAHLRRVLPGILAEARPDLVLYQAGADPYREDQLGSLNLTKKGLRERDRLIFAACEAAGIPVAGTLGGGYARRTQDTVEIHVNTCRAARETFG